MKTLTWKDFEGFNPCYDPKKRYGDWKGTMIDLLNHPQIPIEDKIWAFTRKGIVYDKTLRLFSVACVREVQHLITDQRSLKVLDVAEAFAHGKATKDELDDAAWDAARAAGVAGAAWAARAAGAARAARDTARAAGDAAGAAWDAARDSAWAARDSAWAAGEAAGDSAWDAAWDAAWEESRAKQVEIAIELIKQYEQ